MPHTRVGLTDASVLGAEDVQVAAGMFMAGEAGTGAARAGNDTITDSKIAM
jgi:hypothetical protein